MILTRRKSTPPTTLKDKSETPKKEVTTERDTSCCMLPACTPLSQFLDRKRKAAQQQAEEEREAAKIIDRLLQEDIRTQKSDTSNYRYLQLENGIRVLLVSKADCCTSAAALDVKVGSFSDGTLQGMAHLCEHVLFTGSEKYPRECYSAFLGQRGGSSNAFTASEHTNFHFDVSSTYFEEALDRFVSFFERPLFKEASIQSELEIIQSEHEKNRWNDAWRTNQVERATSQESHAFSRFSTGSRQTLDVSGCPDRNLKYELYSFFKSSYSANLMTVCLIHNQSLDDMEQLAKDYLLRLSNKNLPETIWPGRPFKTRSKIFVVPAKDIYHVNLTFPTEDLRLFYQSAPEGFVAQVLGHKGPGGLFAHLRQLGLAHQLVASGKSLARGLSFFVVTVQVTEAGERRVDEVVKTVFQYIQLIRESGVQKWFFDEIRLLCEQQFEHKAPERPQAYASNICGWLHLYAPKDVLAGDYVIDHFRPDLVRRVLDHLQPDNVRITVVSKNSRYFATQVEPHFGAEYHLENIPDDVLNSWRKCGINPHHSLPKPNPLIARGLLQNQQQQHPDPLRHGPGSLPDLFLSMDRIRMRCWYKLFSHQSTPPPSLLPKCFIYLKLSCPELTNRDAESCCMNNLLAFLIRDALAEKVYYAELAGLFYGLRPTKSGLEVSVRGFVENMHIFLRTVLDALYSAGDDNNASTEEEERFERVLEVHRQGLQSATADSLKSQAKYLLSSILCPTNFSQRQRLEALKEVSYDRWSKYADEFRAMCSVECFFLGDRLSLARADEMSTVAIETRAAFLERLLQRRKDNNSEEEAEMADAEAEQDAHLEDWFLSNPVEKIVRMEEALRNADLTPQAQETSSTATLSSQELKLPVDNNNSGHIFLIHNDVQSSSCVLLFLQYRDCCPESWSLIEVFLGLVRVHLTSTMKHVMSLGYVVGCDVRRMNNTLGFRVVVESQYPLKIVYHTIEKALDTLGDFLDREVNEEYLEMTKQALIAAKDESKAAMRDSAANLWREILEETFHFRRQDEEKAQLSTVTLDRVREFYRDWIHSGGRERRSLVLSIGPDPILNSLDEDDEKSASCLGLDKVPDLQCQCDAFNGLDQEDLKKWFHEVFESKTNQYGQPGLAPTLVEL